MFLLSPLFSAILGVLAFRLSYVAGFVFLAPLFLFFAEEKKFWRFLTGSFVFNFLFLFGAVYFIFEPLIFLLLSLIFSLLSLLIFFSRRFFGNAVFWTTLPFLWTFAVYFGAVLGGQWLFSPTFVLLPGNIFGSSPFLGLAAGGLLTITLFAVVANVLAAKATGSLLTNKRKKVLYFLAALFVFLITCWQASVSFLKKNESFYNSLPSRLRVALVSLNTAGGFDDEFKNFKSRNFFASREEQEKRLEKLLDEKIKPLKRKLLRENFDLVILPESMFYIADARDILLKTYGRLALELNTKLVAVIINKEKNKRPYNSAFLFGENGEIIDVYSKYNLMVIGEYWPFGNWRPFYYEWIKGSYLDENYAVYQPPEKRFVAGEKKNFEFDGVNFALAICVEIHYPSGVKKSKELGAQFISNDSSNRWVKIGLKDYLYMTGNLRRIEAVWLKTPILINGRNEFSGIIAPDGKADLIYTNDPQSDYQVFIGEVKI